MSRRIVVPFRPLEPENWRTLLALGHKPLAGEVEVEVDPNLRFATSRRHVHERLVQNPDAAEIDDFVYERAYFFEWSSICLCSTLLLTLLKTFVIGFSVCFGAAAWIG